MVPLLEDRISVLHLLRTGRQDCSKRSRASAFSCSQALSVRTCAAALILFSAAAPPKAFDCVQACGSLDCPLPARNDVLMVVRLLMYSSSGTMS